MVMDINYIVENIVVVPTILLGVCVLIYIRAVVGNTTTITLTRAEAEAQMADLWQRAGVR